MKNLLFTLLVILTIFACSQEETPAAKASGCKECSTRNVKIIGIRDTLRDTTYNYSKLCSEEEIKNFEGTGSATGNGFKEYWIRSCK